MHIFSSVLTFFVSKGKFSFLTLFSFCLEAVRISYLQRYVRKGSFHLLFTGCTFPTLQKIQLDAAEFMFWNVNCLLCRRYRRVRFGFLRIFCSSSIPKWLIQKVSGWQFRCQEAQDWIYTLLRVCSYPSLPCETCLCWHIIFVNYLQLSYLKYMDSISTSK